MARQESGRIGAGFAVGLVAFLVFAGLCLAPGALFNDGDTNWHLAAGALMLESGSVPGRDSFSFTFAGQPWIAHEWLAEVLMAAAFAAGSWSALGLLFAFAAAGLVLIVGAELRRWLSPARVIGVLLVLIIILAPFTLARPHVLAWPLLAGWTLLLIRARERRRAPPLGAVLLMLAWANLHGSFLFGLILAGAFALEAVVEARDRPTLLRWGGFLLASLLCALATPHGFAAFLFPFQVSGMESLPLIMEWRSTGLRDWEFLAGVAGTLLLLFYTLWVRGIRLSAVRLVLLGAVLLLAFQHVRHEPLLAILVALILAEPLSRPWRREGAPVSAASSVPTLVALVACAVALLVGRLAVPFERQASPSNPLEAIASVPAPLRRAPVLNTYEFGGPLILAGIRPFIDGRADMYGDRFMLQHHAIMDGDRERFRRAVARWGISWTILRPSEKLVRMLDRDPGWRRVHADRWAVVHVADRPAIP